MTLIVGVKCKDGIVVGADGAAAYAALGTNTILQPTKKLTIIDSRIIVGESGAVGLGQRIVGIIEELSKDQTTFSSQSQSSPKKPFQAMTTVREKLHPHLIQELQACAQAAPAVGQQIAISSAIALTVLAVPVQGNPCLFLFDQQGATKAASDDLPFITIGSGQAIADPFLAFLRRIFWPSGTVPNLGDGIFATLWTLVHAIETHPGGVAKPIQIAVLKGNKAKFLEEAEYAEHYQNIEAAEGALKNYRTSLVSSDTTTTPPPVPPPAGH